MACCPYGICQPWEITQSKVLEWKRKSLLGSVNFSSKCGRMINELSCTGREWTFPSLGLSRKIKVTNKCNLNQDESFFLLSESFKKERKRKCNFLLPPNAPVISVKDTNLGVESAIRTLWEPHCVQKYSIYSILFTSKWKNNNADEQNTKQKYWH